MCLEVGRRCILELTNTYTICSWTMTVHWVLEYEHILSLEGITPNRASLLARTVKS